MDRQMSRKVDLLSLLSNFLKYSVMNRDFNQVQILTSLSHPVTSGKLLPSSVGAAWEDAKAALPPGLTPGPSFLQAVPGPHGWGQLHRHFGLWHSALDRGPGQHCALLGPAGGAPAAAA